MRDQPALRSIPIAAIRPSPYQYRTRFDDEKQRQLVESLRSTGLSTPILVRPLAEAGAFELVSGERRWRAAKELGSESIPANCEEMTDAERAARVVTENEVRADTYLMEKAAGYKRLKEPPCNFTLEEIAKRYGYRSHTSVIAITRPTRPTRGNPGACRTCDNRGETRPFSESNQRLEREGQIGETSRGREVVEQFWNVAYGPEHTAASIIGRRQTRSLRIFAHLLCNPVHEGLHAAGEVPPGPVNEQDRHRARAVT